ncbi:unnamed protein product [Amoebophrya sp. A120]|nr:unnamed protein product [Amoebophrya sp. A120]|eukprot:GSA120T00016760001.1
MRRAFPQHGSRNVPCTSGARGGLSIPIFLVIILAAMKRAVLARHPPGSFNRAGKHLAAFALVAQGPREARAARRIAADTAEKIQKLFPGAEILDYSSEDAGEFEQPPWKLADLNTVGNVPAWEDTEVLEKNADDAARYGLVPGTCQAPVANKEKKPPSVLADKTCQSVCVEEEDAYSCFFDPATRWCACKDSTGKTKPKYEVESADAAVTEITEGRAGEIDASSPSLFGAGRCTGNILRTVKNADGATENCQDLCEKKETVVRCFFELTTDHAGCKCRDKNHEYVPDYKTREEAGAEAVVAETEELDAGEAEQTFFYRDLLQCVAPAGKKDLESEVFRAVVDGNRRTCGNVCEQDGKNDAYSCFFDPATRDCGCVHSLNKFKPHYLGAAESVQRVSVEGAGSDDNKNVDFNGRCKGKATRTLGDGGKGCSDVCAQQQTMLDCFFQADAKSCKCRDVNHEYLPIYEAADAGSGDQEIVEPTTEQLTQAAAEPDKNGDGEPESIALHRCSAPGADASMSKVDPSKSCATVCTEKKTAYSCFFDPAARDCGCIDKLNGYVAQYDPPTQARQYVKVEDVAQISLEADLLGCTGSAVRKVSTLAGTEQKCSELCVSKTSLMQCFFEAEAKACLCGDKTHTYVPEYATAPSAAPEDETVHVDGPTEVKFDQAWSEAFFPKQCAAPSDTDSRVFPQKKCGEICENSNHDAYSCFFDPASRDCGCVDSLSLYIPLYEYKPDSDPDALTQELATAEAAANFGNNHCTGKALRKPGEDSEQNCLQLCETKTTATECFFEAFAKACRCRDKTHTFIPDYADGQPPPDAVEIVDVAPVVPTKLPSATAGNYLLDVGRCAVPDGTDGSTKSRVYPKETCTEICSASGDAYACFFDPAARDCGCVDKGSSESESLYKPDYEHTPASGPATPVTTEAAREGTVATDFGADWCVGKRQRSPEGSEKKCDEICAERNTASECFFGTNSELCKCRDVQHNYIPKYAADQEPSEAEEIVPEQGGPTLLSSTAAAGLAMECTGDAARQSKVLSKFNCEQVCTSREEAYRCLFDPAGRDCACTDKDGKFTPNYAYVSGSATVLTRADAENLDADLFKEKGRCTGNEKRVSSHDGKTTCRALCEQQTTALECFFEDNTQACDCRDVKHEYVPDYHASEAAAGHQGDQNAEAQGQTNPALAGDLSTVATGGEETMLFEEGTIPGVGGLKYEPTSTGRDAATLGFANTVNDRLLKEMHDMDAKLTAAANAAGAEAKQTAATLRPVFLTKQLRFLQQADQVTKFFTDEVFTLMVNQTTLTADVAIALEVSQYANATSSGGAKSAASSLVVHEKAVETAARAFAMRMRQHLNDHTSETSDLPWAAEWAPETSAGATHRPGSVVPLYAEVSQVKQMDAALIDTFLRETVLKSGVVENAKPEEEKELNHTTQKFFYDLRGVMLDSVALGGDTVQDRRAELYGHAVRDLFFATFAGPVVLTEAAAQELADKLAAAGKPAFDGRCAGSDASGDGCEKLCSEKVDAHNCFFAAEGKNCQCHDKNFEYFADYNTALVASAPPRAEAFAAEAVIATDAQEFARKQRVAVKAARDLRTTVLRGASSNFGVSASCCGDALSAAERLSGDAPEQATAAKGLFGSASSSFAQTVPAVERCPDVKQLAVKIQGDITTDLLGDANADVRYFNLYLGADMLETQQGPEEDRRVRFVLREAIVTSPSQPQGGIVPSVSHKVLVVSAVDFFALAKPLFQFLEWDCPAECFVVVLGSQFELGGHETIGQDTLALDERAYLSWLKKHVYMFSDRVRFALLSADYRSHLLEWMGSQRLSYNLPEEVQTRALLVSNQYNEHIGSEQPAAPTLSPYDVLALLESQVEALWLGRQLQKISAYQEEGADTSFEVISLSEGVSSAVAFIAVGGEWTWPPDDNEGVDRDVAINKHHESCTKKNLDENFTALMKVLDSYKQNQDDGDATTGDASGGTATGDSGTGGTGSTGTGDASGGGDQGASDAAGTATSFTTLKAEVNDEIKEDERKNFCKRLFSCVYDGAEPKSLIPLCFFPLDPVTVHIPDTKVLSVVAPSPDSDQSSEPHQLVAVLSDHEGSQHQNMCHVYEPPRAVLTAGWDEKTTVHGLVLHPDHCDATSTTCTIVTEHGQFIEAPTTNIRWTKREEGRASLFSDDTVKNLIMHLSDHDLAEFVKHDPADNPLFNSAGVKKPLMNTATARRVGDEPHQAVRGKKEPPPTKKFSSWRFWVIVVCLCLVPLLVTAVVVYLLCFHKKEDQEEEVLGNTNPPAGTDRTGKSLRLEEFLAGKNLSSTKAEGDDSDSSEDDGTKPPKSVAELERDLLEAGLGGKYARELAQWIFDQQKQAEDQKAGTFVATASTPLYSAMPTPSDAGDVEFYSAIFGQMESATMGAGHHSVKAVKSALRRAKKKAKGKAAPKRKVQSVTKLRGSSRKITNEDVPVATFLSTQQRQVPGESGLQSGTGSAAELGSAEQVRALGGFAPGVRRGASRSGAAASAKKGALGAAGPKSSGAASSTVQPKSGGSSGRSSSKPKSGQASRDSSKPKSSGPAHQDSGILATSGGSKFMSMAKAKLQGRPEGSAADAHSILSDEVLIVSGDQSSASASEEVPQPSFADRQQERNQRIVEEARQSRQRVATEGEAESLRQAAHFSLYTRAEVESEGREDAAEEL